MAANLAPSLAEEMTRLLQGPDTEKLTRMLSASMSNVTENEKSKALLALFGEQMEQLSPTRGAPYLSALVGVIASLNGLRDVAFGRQQYALLISQAKSWMAVKAYEKVVETDLKVLNVPPNMEKNVLPLEKLESVMRLLASAVHVDDPSVTEAVLFRAMPQYRRVCRQLAASEQMEASRPTLVAFLEVLGTSQQRRGFFVDASRAFAERYEKGDDGCDFERAVVCALLAETSAQRARLVEAYHLAPESRRLGPLRGLLAKAFHVQLLTADDSAALAQSNLVSSGCVPEDAVRTAVNQHNIVAISNVFDNISFAALANQLDGMQSESVGAVVVRMVSEGRLRAKVDQASQWIIFRTPESVSAMTEWDNKLGAICNAISHATELITVAYPEYRSYLHGENQR